MRWWARVLLAVLVVVLSGCWPQAGGGARRERYNPWERGIDPSNVADLEQAWHVDVQVDSVEPVVWGDTVYLRNGGGVTAVRLSDGSVRWQRGLTGGGAPVVLDGKLWVPTWPVGEYRIVDCTLVALDLATGEEVERHRLVGPGPANPTQGGCAATASVAVGTKVVVAWSWSRIETSSPSCGSTQASWTWGPLVTALDVENPARSWQRFGGQTFCTAGPPTGVPLPVVEQISSDGSELVAIVRDQQSPGFTVMGGPVECPSPEGCPPRWTLPLDGTTKAAPVVLANGDIAVTRFRGVPEESERVEIIDGTTHAVEWSIRASDLAGDWWVGAPLAATSTTIVVATYRHPPHPANSGSLSAFPAGGCGRPTCAPSWTTTVPGSNVAPVVAGGVVFVSGYEALLAYDAAGCGAATCAPLWTQAIPVTDPPSVPTVIVAQGHVLTYGVNGHGVTAYALPD